MTKFLTFPLSAAVVIFYGAAVIADDKLTNPASYQLEEGHNLAGTLKYLVQKRYRESGNIPQSLREAGATPDPDDINGAYVSSTNIIGGVIIVTFGKKSNPQINGKTLTFIPFESAEGSIEWKCGYPELYSDRETLGTFGGNPVKPRASTVPFSVAARYCK